MNSGAKEVFQGAILGAFVVGAAGGGMGLLGLSVAVGEWAAFGQADANSIVCAAGGFTWCAMLCAVAFVLWLVMRKIGKNHE